jgi:hypothetical protein
VLFQKSLFTERQKMTNSRIFVFVPLLLLLVHLVVGPNAQGIPTPTNLGETSSFPEIRR